MEIGKNLKLFRTNLSMTQVELADMVGVTYNYISMIENGKRLPSLELLEKLAEALDVHITRLFVNPIPEVPRRHDQNCLEGSEHSGSWIGRRRMAKCKVCKTTEAVWAWQPFGPNETPLCFTTLGSHYRGFPVIKVCDDCHSDIKWGVPVEFEYRVSTYMADDARVLLVPAYVGDPLHWFVEQSP
jgi:DNA-binding XRE family transcriptional regulator